MPARKSKPKAETTPLVLTAPQRAALDAIPGLKTALRDRLLAVSKPKEGVALKADELTHLGNAAFDAIDRKGAPPTRTLEALLDRVSAALDVLEERERERRRAALPISGKVYQVRVTLRNIEPRIWRRFLIADGTLLDLHDAIQDVMGWDDGHMHQFLVESGKGREKVRTYYGTPEGDEDEEEEDEAFADLLRDIPVTRDEQKALLSQLAPTGRKHAKFLYEYDFGDGWVHEVVIEKTLDPQPGVAYPVCLEGARACPPEDCGGPWGYANFVQAMTGPKTERQAELRDWYDGPFDPEAFSLDAANARIRMRRRVT
jgi:hypothetical protein